MKHRRTSAGLIGGFLAFGLGLGWWHAATTEPSATFRRAVRTSASPAPELSDVWRAELLHDRLAATDPDGPRDCYRSSWAGTTSMQVSCWGVCPVCRHTYLHARVRDFLTPKAGRLVTRDCACRWDDDAGVAVWPDRPGSYPPAQGR